MKQAGPEGARQIVAWSEEGEASKLGDGNVDEQNRKRGEMQKDDNCGYIRKKLDHA